MQLLHRFNDLSSCIAAGDGLAHIALAGDVTTQNAGTMLANAATDVSRLHAWAMVARYDGARLAMGPDVLLSSATAPMASHQGALRLPTALVVRPDELEMWRVYCDLQGRNGILRAAFTSHAQAVTWAQDHAALWRAQLTWSVRALSRQ